MPGHRLPKSIRTAIRRGAVVQVRRGWRRGELASSAAGPCFRINPETGERAGVEIRVPAGQLKISTRTPWAFQRPVRPC